jgi:glycosyltransferase involved in cell wall biosynthesis
MRICLIYQGEYPPAERIEKVAKTLDAAGHDVFVLCNNYGCHAGGVELGPYHHVVRPKAHFANRTLNRIVNFPLFLNPLWLLVILRTVLRFRIDALQVIDIPLAPAALAIGRLLGKRVVMDMWENYPEALKGWAKLDWKVRVFKNPAVARAVERFVTPRMDHIFVVVDEQKQRLIEDGVNSDHISIVTNAADVDMFSGGTAAGQTPLDQEPDAYKLLYVGFVTVERGLDDIIRALGLVKTELPQVRLYIAGTGNYCQELRRLAKAENVEHLVRFTGWVAFDQIRFYIAKSDLCLIPHVRSSFIDTTIPNKIFQYMLVGKPLLVSDAKPLARVVRDCNCGFVFESGNAESAAAAIRAAYEARHDTTLGQRGRETVLAKYTWDKAAAGLVDYYRRIERDSTAGNPVATTLGQP